jgi:hypothetical protein
MMDPLLLSSDGEEEDEDQLISSSQVSLTAAVQAVMHSTESAAKRVKVDHRSLPRSSRRKFCSGEALHCIKRDFTGYPGNPDTPLMGAEFKLIFRISRQRFQVMMEDVMAKKIPFYKVKVNRMPYEQASLEAKLLLPLKTLSYGVPAHTFMDYFQMSRTFCKTCCKEFDKAMKLTYMDEYCRLPTAADLKSITNLHKAIHGVDGIVGSLDCTHTYWKNCPKAWQGSYQGKEKRPSIVLEAMADYHLFFWHACYAYPGNMNDKTIFSLSPLLDRMLDGSFHEVEQEAGLVPFKIHNEEFTKTFILVDGIYPKYSRFVTPKTEPILPEEKKYTQWQEAVRKDIERAFGVLKGTWQFMERPIHLMNLDDIQAKVVCCVILHNILVSDRVMGDCRTRYKPDQVLEEEVVVQQPTDLRQVQESSTGERTHPFRPRPRTPTQTASGSATMLPVPWQQVPGLTRQDRFKELSDFHEYNRLRTALTARFIRDPTGETQRASSNGDNAAAVPDGSTEEGSSNGEGAAAAAEPGPSAAAGDP